MKTWSSCGERIRLTGAVGLVGALLAGFTARANAQTAGDLAAWGALMLSPAGALPALAHDELLAGASNRELTVRYGRWRYDEDDAIHNDFGLTLARPLGGGATRIALTASYLSSSCGTCTGWLGGGVDVQRRLLRVSFRGDSTQAMSGTLGLHVTAGGARSSGPGHAIASSVSGAPVLGVTVPFVRASRLSLSVLPGLGIGRLSSPDESAAGIRPMLGTTAAWTLSSGAVVDLGLQRIFIDGGPAQLGLGITWVRQ